MRPCKMCGNPFDPAADTSRYCNPCKSVDCEECGIRFENPKPNRTTRFCSLKCRSVFRFRGKRIEKPCDYCGSKVSKAISAVKGGFYCNGTCRSKAFWANGKMRQVMSDAIRNNPACRSKARIKQLHKIRALRRSPMSEETKELIRKARLKQRFPIKMTSIEQTLCDAFRKLRLKFEMHQTMFGRWQPDFVFESAHLIVQADGDYWHSRPHAVANDMRFNSVALQAGWKVMRFSETDILQHSGRCVLSVVKYLSKRK